MDAVERKAIGLASRLTRSMQQIKGQILLLREAAAEDMTRDLTRHVEDLAEECALLDFQLQGMQMRHAAAEEKHWGWYAAATYLLLQDWGEVAESIDWVRWGGFIYADDRPLQAVALLVGATTKLPCEKAHELARAIDPQEGAAVFDRAIEHDVVIKQKGAYLPGSNMPEPV